MATRINISLPGDYYLRLMALGVSPSRFMKNAIIREENRRKSELSAFIVAAKGILWALT